MNDFFDDMQIQVIQSHSREWISLKLTAVKYLRDIDNKLIGTNGQRFQESFSNLNMILYNDPSKVFSDAR